MKFPKNNREANEQLVDQKGCQTKLRGDNNQEFQIFKACAEDLGWTIPTFEEWLGR